MNVGFDLHGVINQSKKFLKLAKEIKKDNGKVYVITGNPVDKKLIKELKKYGWTEKLYDGIFSIQDELDKQGIPVVMLDKFGRNHYEENSWDRCKADICKINDIDVHIDDTLRYSKYFIDRTVFGYYHKKKLEYLI
jgi:hypothetical protein